MKNTQQIHMHTQRNNGNLKRTPINYHWKYHCQILILQIECKIIIKMCNVARKKFLWVEINLFVHRSHLPLVLIIDRSKHELLCTCRRLEGHRKGYIYHLCECSLAASAKDGLTFQTQLSDLRNGISFRAVSIL